MAKHDINLTNGETTDETTELLREQNTENDSGCIPTKRTVAGVLTTAGVAATTGALGGAAGYGLWKFFSLGGAWMAPSAPATTCIGWGAGACGGIGGLYTGLRFFGEQPNNPQPAELVPPPTPTLTSRVMSE